jgi:hypothetical protein
MMPGKLGASRSYLTYLPMIPFRQQLANIVKGVLQLKSTDQKGGPCVVPAL